MNSEAEGLTIGPKGSVCPYVAKELLKRAKRFTLGKMGTPTVQTTALVGIALESSDDESRKNYSSVYLKYKY